ncbi:MAG: hypothetical protein D6796_15120, partial [Caldilineae bacterium]
MNRKPKILIALLLTALLSIILLKPERPPAVNSRAAYTIISLNGALIVARVPTAELLAWVGSTSYFDKAKAGSTLKPFLYAYALD